MFDVVGIGANSVDFVNLLPGYPQQQGTFAKMRIREQTICLGGQMATALSTCASLGLKTKYIGATGTDENGRLLRQELTRRGVDMADAVIRDAPNQFAVILVDESSGERIVLWDRNERLALRARELPDEAICAGRLLHVDDVDQAAAIRAAKIARDAGLAVTSDIDRINDQTDALIASVTTFSLKAWRPSFHAARSAAIGSAGNSPRASSSLQCSSASENKPGNGGNKGRRRWKALCGNSKLKNVASAFSNWLATGST